MLFLNFWWNSLTLWPRRIKKEASVYLSQFLKPMASFLFFIPSMFHRMLISAYCAPSSNVVLSRAFSIATPITWTNCHLTLFRWFQTETALMYDAVHLFAKALDEVSRAQEIAVDPLSCSKAKPWDNGNSLLNYMKMVSGKNCHRLFLTTCTETREGNWRHEDARDALQVWRYALIMHTCPEFL